jgi:hypothetical protein
MEPGSISSVGKSNISLWALTLCNLSDLGNISMRKCNRSQINTGRRPKRWVGDIGVPNDSWGIACDLFFCRILSNDPNPADVNKLFQESYREAYKILSTSIKVFDVSKAAIHTVSIRTIHALLSSTNNQARGLPTSCLSTVCHTAC